jgi:thiamine-phosphate pyrophosphorylase
MRLKDAEDEAILRAAEVLRPVCQDRDVTFLLNDRPDLVRETGCDGVHLGQGDTPYAESRVIMGPDAVIGVSCHDSRHLAIEAAGAGADYVAFGAFFPTSTKKAEGNPSPEILSWWRDIGNVPAVAIGGITPDNAPSLIEAGADFLAVISAVWDHEHGPAKALKAFHRVLAETSA